MASTARAADGYRPHPRHQPGDGGLGTKKTIFVIATVVGCIAILWPKVFYPLLIGGGTIAPPLPILPKDRPGSTGRCFGVVLTPGNQAAAEESPRHMKMDYVCLLSHTCTT